MSMHIERANSASASTSIVVDHPEPGCFKLRLYKDGWHAVPARILLTDDLWSAEIDGEPAGLPHHEPEHADGVLRIWHSRKTEITESEYRFLTVDLKEWAREHYPDHPLLDPSKPVRLNTLRPIPAHTAPTAPEQASDEPANAPARPHPPSVPEIVEWLDYENESLVKAIEHDILQLREDKGVSITEDGQLSRIAANVSIARAHGRQAEKTRTDQQKPFKDGNNAVQKWFKGLTDSLDMALLPVQGEMNRYGTAKENQRRAEAEAKALALRQEAERQAAAAEAALRKNAPLADARLDAATTAAAAADKAEAFAAGKSSDLTRSHTDYGTTVSGQETWGWEVVDISKVPLRFLQINETLMNKEIREWCRDHIEEARAGISPNPGIRVTRSIAMRTR